MKEQITSIHEDLDLFLKTNKIIELVKALNIPDDFDIPIKDDANDVVLFHSFGSYDFDLIPELEERIEKIKKTQTLGEYVEALLKERKKEIPDLHLRAGISKEYWHKIIKGKIKKPSKAKLLCIAIALKLNLEETEKLLRKAGYSFTTDLTPLEAIIGYFIEKGNYSIYEIDCQLMRYNQPTIFSIE